MRDSTASVSNVISGKGSPAAAERAEHLHHETAVRTAGLLFYVAGGALAIAAVAVIALRSGEAAVRSMSTFGLLAGGYAFAGLLLRRLDARARYAATLMGVLGLLAMPIGTVLNGYVLWLIHSKKGRRVLSPEYRDVVAQAPEYECRVAHSVKAMGILLVTVAVAGVLRGALRY